MILSRFTSIQSSLVDKKRMSFADIAHILKGRSNLCYLTLAMIHNENTSDTRSKIFMGYGRRQRHSSLLSPGGRRVLDEYSSTGAGGGAIAEVVP